jgi:uncharacterized membrane protein
VKHDGYNQRASNINSEALIMKWVVNIVAVLLILPGIIFFLQGINVLPGSSMTGQAQWAVIGGLMVIVGVGMLVFSRRGIRL